MKDHKNTYKEKKIQLNLLHKVYQQRRVKNEYFRDFSPFTKRRYLLVYQKQSILFTKDES